MILPKFTQKHQLIQSCKAPYNRVLHAPIQLLCVSFTHLAWFSLAIQEVVITCYAMPIVIKREMHALCVNFTLTKGSG
jgi:hypothetical protein